MTSRARFSPEQDGWPEVVITADCHRHLLMWTVAPCPEKPTGAARVFNSLGAALDEVRYLPSWVIGCLDVDLTDRSAYSAILLRSGPHGIEAVGHE